MPYIDLETLIVQLHNVTGAMRRNMDQWGSTPNAAQLERIMSLVGQMEDDLRARDYRLDLTVQLSDSLREDAAESGESLEERALRFGPTRPLAPQRRAFRMEEISIHSKAAIRRLREEARAKCGCGRWDCDACDPDYRSKFRDAVWEEVARLNAEEMARLEEPAPCDPGIPGFTPSID